jgi:hypothetical protein
MKQKKKLLRNGMIDDYVSGEPNGEKADPFGSFRIFLSIHWYPFGLSIVSQMIHDDPKGSKRIQGSGIRFFPIR